MKTSIVHPELREQPRCQRAQGSNQILGLVILRGWYDFGAELYHYLPR